MGFKIQKKAVALTSLVIWCLASASAGWAFAPEGDLLKIKGYSPEVIQTTSTQRSRQEWREPSARKSSPMERFFHNVYYGNWTGDLDDFGSGVIRQE